MRKLGPGVCAVRGTVVLLSLAAAVAAQIPVDLPDPDGRAGDPSKPVQVYILAGQSNMVGMGDLSGAQNVYTGVYLSSDPAVPEGPLPIYRVGNFKVGRILTFRENGEETEAPLERGSLEVPETGSYRVHCGFAGQPDCVMRIDGAEVFRRPAGDGWNPDPITLRAGQRYRFDLDGVQGMPPRLWMERADLLGHGDLEAVVRREGKFPWLIDDAGAWTVRHDVYFQEARLAEGGKGSPLSATSNGKSIGPELGFGHVLGEFHDAQVLLIKTAQGNRSLGFDFRPPSSGRTAPDNEFEAAEYRLMVKGVRDTLARIGEVVPDYQGQGYEIAGFVWFQGHKDSGSDQAIAEYEQHLVHLIQDVRAEFDVPDLPVVVGTVGFGGAAMADKFLRILDAQMAVGDADRHPEFAGRVASVDTRPFWREVDESPKNQDYHYHRNAETYLLIGDALGRAMVGLRGGVAAERPVAVRRAARGGSAASGERTAAEREALRPIVLDGIAAAYARDPRQRAALEQERSQVRDPKANQFLRGATFGLVNCYQEVGIDAYDWKPFGPDLDAVEWDYTSFDPPETQPLDQPNRFRTVTFPDGCASWFVPDFEPVAVGWGSGKQPFGQLDGQLEPLSPNCSAPFCRCGEPPRTLWEKEVLLGRATLDVPPLREGHRYRIVVGGSAHVQAGEGYALWIDGEPLFTSTVGVGMRQGGQPRGAMIDEAARVVADPIEVLRQPSVPLAHLHRRDLLPDDVVEEGRLRERARDRVARVHRDASHAVD
ncbi:MAG: sialate O-acetylesterase, partial [Planctomycetota bacterium]